MPNWINFDDLLCNFIGDEHDPNYPTLFLAGRKVPRSG